MRPGQLSGLRKVRTARVRPPRGAARLAGPIVRTGPRCTAQKRKPMLGCRLAAGAATLLVALGAHAQYPDRTVRIVVPFAAGGGTDVQARAAAARLAARFKQPFIVENRGGAG